LTKEQEDMRRYVVTITAIPSPSTNKLMLFYAGISICERTTSGLYLN